MSQCGTLKDLGIEQLTAMEGGQPRTRFVEAELQELAESIKREGIIQPIVVRQIAPLKYEIIAGERRWRAAQLAGETVVPCVVKSLEGRRAFITALAENLFRKDLTAYEEALSFAEVVDYLKSTGEKGTHEQVAELTGCSRTMVVKALHVLSLSKASIAYFRDYPDSLTKGHASAIQGLDERDEVKLVERILSDSLSVRATEVAARKIKDSYARIKPDYTSAESVDLKAVERQISEAFGCEVTIHVSPKSNKYELKMVTVGGDCFEGILDRLGLQRDDVEAA